MTAIRKMKKKEHLKQAKELLNAISLLQDTKSFRAAMLLSYAALSHYIREFLTTQGFSDIQSLGNFDGINWNSVHTHNDLENITENKIVNAFLEIYRRKMSTAPPALRRINSNIDGMRIERNNATHGFSTEINQETAISYLTRIVDAFVEITEKRRICFQPWVPMP